MTTQDEIPVETIGPDDYAYTAQELAGTDLTAQSRTVTRQVQALVTLPDATELERLAHRRSERDDHVALLPYGRATGVFVANAEVLVRGDAGLASRPGFTVEDTPSVTGADGPRDAFGGRIQRVRATDGREDGVREALAAAQDRKLYAAPNLALTLAPVVKGDGSPENSSIRRGFPTALAERLGDEGRVHVAIIDTGIAAAPRTDGWLDNVRTTDDNVDALDVLPLPNGLLDLGAGHGTFAAGIVQQVCPTADIRVYRAVDTDGVGKEDEVAAAMVQAVENGAQILSLSLGSTSEDDVPPVALRTVLEDLEVNHPDVVVIAAAGNNGDTRPVWPAAFKQVVAVGALRADLSPATWSSHGFWVDCSTVGEGVVSTFVPGDESDEYGGSHFEDDAWAMWSGTSFTAPQIAGALARLVQGNRSLGWTPRRALKHLLDGGSWVPGYGTAVQLLPGTAHTTG